jgi:hypothetical protein
MLKRQFLFLRLRFAISKPSKYRQRAPVHRPGLQGVRPPGRSDPCQNLALLSPVQRQNRTLAQVAQSRLHPASTPLDIEQARRLIADFVEHYNTVRLHSAIGYITPQDKLLGKEKAIFAARDQKLAQARRQRKIKRQNQPALSVSTQLDFSN